MKYYTMAQSNDTKDSVTPKRPKQQDATDGSAPNGSNANFAVYLNHDDVTTLVATLDKDKGETEALAAASEYFDRSSSSM